MLNAIYRFFYPAKSSLEIVEKYNIPKSISLHVVYNDGWFVATSKELPGLITQAQTEKELMQMVNDAVLTYFDVPKREIDILDSKMTKKNGQSISFQEDKTLQLV